MLSVYSQDCPPVIPPGNPTDFIDPSLLSFDIDGNGVLQHIFSDDMNTELRVGAVRYYKFINSLHIGETGLQLIALGFPVDSSPEMLEMKGNGFVASNSAGGACQVKAWYGDNAPGTRGYNVYFHGDGR